MAGLCLCLWAAPARALVRVDLLEESTDDDLFLDSLRVQDEFRAHAEHEFADVPRDHWAYDAVSRLGGLGLLQGAEGEEVFQGNGLVTRYEMAALVARMVDRYLDLKSNGLIQIGRVRPSATHRTPDPFARAGMNLKEIDGEAPVLKPLSDSATTPGQTPEQAPVVMEQTDVKKLEDLVNSFSSELRNFQSDVKKELTAGKKVYMKGQKDIQSLQEENQRFAWKGRAELAYVNQGEQDADTQVLWDNRLELDISSKPAPGEDFTIGATLAAETELGGRKNVEGLFDGSSAPLSLNKFYLNYSNPKARDTTKKFFFRKLDVGNISVDFSPTTAFGTQWEGIQSQFQAYKWTLNLMGARTEHRRQYLDALGHPFTFVGTDEDGSEGVAVQMRGLPYDRYVYGASLQGTFLNNPLSLFRISQINLFEDKDSVQMCEKINAVSGDCENYLENGEFMFLTDDQVGSLASPGYPQDKLAAPGGSGDSRVGQLKLPAEKNKVQSVFLRYPVSEKHNLFFTGEFAKSKYYRPGFKVVKTSSAPPNEDQEPGLTSPDITKFRVVPEQDWEGSAMLALLDWSRGPLKIFPAGYARLSPRFVARYLGLPGLDVNSLLNVGGLPLNIQSLEAWLLAPTYNRPDDKYSIGGLFAKIQEVEPIYFDAGLITGIPSLSGIAPLTIMERLNNRRARLAVGVTNLNGEFYASPRMTLKAGFTRAAVNLYDACIDGKAANIAKDLNGDELVSTFGDGYANCQNKGSFNPLLPDDTFAPFALNIRFITKSMAAEWQASKKAKYNLSFAISDLINNTQSPSELGPNGIIEALYNRRTYTLKQSLDYDINNSTSLNFGLERVFDKNTEGTDTPGGTGADPGANGTLISPVDDYYIFTAKVKTEF